MNVATYFVFAVLLSWGVFILMSWTWSLFWNPELLYWHQPWSHIELLLSLDLGLAYVIVRMFRFHRMPL